MDGETRFYELNQKTLRAMLVELGWYRGGRTSFFALVNALDAGISSLYRAKEGLSEILKEKWITLEIINAMALDLEPPLHFPRAEDRALAEKTIREIEDIIEMDLGR